MTVAAIIQARMGSTRLPGKVLKPIIGKPILWHVVNRTRQARLVDKVIVATTTLEDDQPIVDLCTSEGWLCFRGSENDLLDRYYQAASHYGADVIVRITSDCPLIDPGVIDLVVQTFLQGRPELDYVSNTLPPRTFPRGLDTEAVSLATLQRVWTEDSNPAWREHVTPYIYRHPERFNLKSVTASIDHSDMRWTVDTPQDFEFVCKVFEYFKNGFFGWREVLDLLRKHPEWLDINREIKQKVVP